METARQTLTRALFDAAEVEVSKDDKHAYGDYCKRLASRSELLPSSALFPAQLRELKDPPKKLYVLGNPELLLKPSIALVGARKATPYGLECAKRFARKAATWGITVVSGGAIGNDMAAHRGALEAGGKTIVVLGSGANVVYPLRARDLLMEVLETGGSLVSEAPWGSPPLSWAFSKRNRIIAGLARATLIVEAGLPSGTFQTADHTLALGNEVLVVPGPIFSQESKGSNRLLAQGATPIVDEECFEDVLEQLFELPCSFFAKEETKFQGQELSADKRSHEKIQVNKRTNDTATDKKIPIEDSLVKASSGSKPHEIKARRLREQVLSSLAACPMTIDEIALAHGKDTVELVRFISQLEVSGLVERLRDGRYMTKPR